MLCTGFGTGSIGGTQNLFSLGTCPDKNPNGPTCVNQNSHTSTSAAFFKHGGKYWFNDNDFVGTTFSGNPKVTCTIGKGSGSSKMVRDEDGGEEGGRDRNASRHSHQHHGRAHARSLVQLIAGS